MKTNTINLQIVINCGNYESLRLGGEWTKDAEQTDADALLEADKILRDAAASILAQRTQEAAQRVQEAQKVAETEQKTEKSAEQKRERVVMGERFKAILKRMQDRNISLEEAEKYFDFDEECLKVISLAKRLDLEVEK